MLNRLFYGFILALLLNFPAFAVDVPSFCSDLSNPKYDAKTREALSGACKTLVDTNVTLNNSNKVMEEHNQKMRDITADLKKTTDEAHQYNEQSRLQKLQRGY